MSNVSSRCTTGRGIAGIAGMLTLVWTAVACGGGESRPGPLAHHFDDMYIAQIPLSEKQAVLSAQNEYAAARMGRQTSEAEYNESATELEVAKNERAQAELDKKSEESRRKAAEESGDMNRINAVGLKVRSAALAVQAADKKVAYVEARRSFLRKKLLQAEDEMYAAEAQYELAKARVAQSNDIRPREFVFASYQSQAQERSRQAQRSRAQLQRDQAALEQLRKAWQSSKQAADRARSGGQGQNPGSSWQLVAPTQRGA